MRYSNVAASRSNQENAFAHDAPSVLRVLRIFDVSQNSRSRSKVFRHYRDRNNSSDVVAPVLQNWRRVRYRPLTNNVVDHPELLEGAEFTLQLMTPPPDWSELLQLPGCVLATDASSKVAGRLEKKYDTCAEVPLVLPRMPTLVKLAILMDGNSTHSSLEHVIASINTIALPAQAGRGAVSRNREIISNLYIVSSEHFGQRGVCWLQKLNTEATTPGRE